MNRRKFNLLAGSSLASVTALRSAKAQSASPDPSLLTTTLTPFGAERAGNADGSIPAWTGGLVAPPVGPDTPALVQVFTGEQPLYTVDASNMAQYAHLLSAATQVQITKFGWSLKVYQTHRTSAAPQYVYDNMAKNVTRAQLDPAGGRYGFTNAYGGVPFPILDTSDPLKAGAQAIWNHLTVFGGYSIQDIFTSSFVVINGQQILVNGTVGYSIYPYYDPNGSLETFDGYYSKVRSDTIMPGSVDGQEILIWHSSNTRQKADITWTLLNGEARVRKAPNEQYDSPEAATNGISNVDENSMFYGDPQQFDWKLIGKQELLIPYNCNVMDFTQASEFLLPKFPNPDMVRWEKHRVYVIEATLHEGYRNVVPHRRFYIDEDSWYGAMGDGYDANGNLIKGYNQYLGVVPSMPSIQEVASAIWDLNSGDYAINGPLSTGSHVAQLLIKPVDDSLFDPQQMAAASSF
ncbi:hypothetical protein GCM10010909_13090 [Acidocella aquatica]|uniref:DUF1329 domain-containing protein n=1 Tax=Acidocella aquatica TaxID=1922313 RepID=A0ABQ6A8Z9_9PROT|nr:DUF1329 domain-containing protein [Acidocella aquatica]GLR66629.1 hypothetical protein GCM10010909_13090 [Acidocella aquatica]